MLVFCTLGCGPVEQTGSCRSFVACVEELDVARGTSTDAERYLPDGACWGGEKIAELCDRSCIKGLTLLGTQQPSLGCLKEGASP